MNVHSKENIPRRNSRRKASFGKIFNENQSSSKRCDEGSQQKRMTLQDISNKSRILDNNSQKAPKPMEIEVFSTCPKYTTQNISKLSETTNESFKTPPEYLNQSESITNSTFNFDASNQSNILEAPEYAIHVFRYMRSREKTFVITTDYMNCIQTDLRWRMRQTLIDWLIELTESLEITHETLYLSVKYLDMYLSKVKVKKCQLQLVGATALFIASKFEERRALQSDEIVYYTDNTYTREQLFVMEREMLNNLNFNLNAPISYRFLRRFAKCTHTTIQRLTLARYILESSLLNHKFLLYFDSHLAASCLWLSFKMFEPICDWDEVIQHYSGYKENEVLDLATKLNEWISEMKNEHLSVTSKYGDEIYFAVSKINPLTIEQINSEKKE